MNKQEFFDQCFNEKIDLDLPQNEEKCIIIGAGPSLERKNLLERFVKLNFKGVIIVTDYALVRCLKIGITPNRYPKYFVSSGENSKEVADCYSNPVVKDYASKIVAIFTTVHPVVKRHCLDYGFKIYEIGDTQIMRVLANIGAMSWPMAFKILHCKKIAFLGFDQGFYPDKLPFDINHPKLYDLIYVHGYNQALQCEYVLDPFYQYFSMAINDALTHAPKDVQVYNCTEAGSIQSNRVQNCTIEEFVNEH